MRFSKIPKTVQGPVSRKPRKLIGPAKPFFVICILKTENHIGPKLCMKGTSVHIKNIMELNSSVIIRLEILLWLSGCENFPGPSRNGPRARKVTRKAPENVFSCFSKVPKSVWAGKHLRFEAYLWHILRVPKSVPQHVRFSHSKVYFSAKAHGKLSVLPKQHGFPYLNNF